MRHYASSSFWKQFDSLPEDVRNLAEKNYRLLKVDERHPSLNLKKIDDLWSVRVGLHYRALGVDASDGILWFWIGSHAEYDKFLS
jgi:hypothetical protein